ncbi:MAG: GDP-mannose 4,6-dehydratase [Chitinophagales bacterium]|nr:GDP-mannose 4,6-dehydratase [Chitinophagales bacterium]
MKNILITGGAGFIGSHLVEYLLANTPYQITIIDNFEPFYDPMVKRANIEKALQNSRTRLIEGDINDNDFLQNQLAAHYDCIVHLAAKAGVRPSIQQARQYYTTNVSGTQNLLEWAAQHHTPQFVFASSSSVYGTNPNVPWRESDALLLPISPYASTKISAELLGHVYSHLYNIRFLALRFFTVYGPRQRPDLAIHKFVKHINNNKPIPFYGNGNTRRDYTFVADIVQAIVAAIHYDQSPYEIINIGNHHTVSLSELVETIEELLDKKAELQRLPEQTGDVPQTFADIFKAQHLLNYHPQTPLREGIAQFIAWYAQQYPTLVEV